MKLESTAIVFPQISMMRKLLLALGIFLALARAAFATCGPDPVPACGSSPVPVGALQAGFTQQTFCDDFTTLETIDTTNSNTAGFNWYPGQAWPLAAQTAGWTNFATVPSTYYSIVEGGGLLISPTSTFGGPVLATCYPLSDAPFIGGHLFTHGFYLAVTACWEDPPPFWKKKSWPAVWSFPSEFLIGGTSSPLNIIELDNEEAPYGRHLHYWKFSEGKGTRYDMTLDSTVKSGTEYALLVVPADLNNGTPAVDIFTNGTYTPTALNLPFSDTFTLAATQHMCILLSADSTWPMTVKKVAVWQSPRRSPKVK